MQTSPTESTDDIINVASSVVPNFGFFQNAGKTLRRGIEAKVDYRQDRWKAYANYTFVDATYQSALTLQSPNNPAAADPDNPLNLRQTGRSHPGHSGSPLQGRCRIRRYGRLEGRGRP